MKRPTLPITVDDLKAFLDRFPGDMKVGVRGGLGGSFQGFADVEPLTLITFIGKEGDKIVERLTLATDDPIAKKFLAQDAPHEGPFTALIFD